MHLYNTLTKKVEKFTPWDEKEVKIYTCGPTVYHYAHIGNLRTYIMEDILEKSLVYVGYNVKRVMNVTDIGHLSSDDDFGDDKMVDAAKKENKTVLDIAKYYTDAFFEDAGKLNIKTPEIVTPATDHIDKYIKMISKLLEDGYAYKSEGNVYFDTSKINNYYSLTNQSEEDLISGSRETVEEDKAKRNKSDFVLWFTKSKFEDQELKWDSPFGEGYPGWHIECSGISLKYLGDQLDIHCGGVDNIFPHHTNEIAQSEAYTGKPWCKYWIHGEHLNDESGKMSKSKGETLTVSLLEEKGYMPLSFRFMSLMSHYRNQLTFSYESLDIAESSYIKLKRRALLLENKGEINKEIFNKYDELFKGFLNNDLNTASTITLIYDLLKDDVNDKTKYELIKSWDTVLSLDLLVPHELQVDEDYILERIKERQVAKDNKDYALADKIREELLEKNIVLKDGREGTTYEVIK